MVGVRTGLVLAVAACSGGGGSSDSVTITAPNAPSATIAFRDGDEAWETSSAEAPITFPVLSGRYSVVVACQNRGATTVVAYLFTLANTRELVHDHWCRIGELNITGTLVNGDASSVAIGWGETVGGFAEIGQVDYAIQVGAGTSELFALSIPFLDAERGVIRSLEVTNDVAGQDLDLLGPDSFELDRVSLGFGPDNTADPIVASAILARASGMRTQTSTVIADAGTVRALPAGVASDDDMYLVRASKSPGDPSSSRIRRFSSVDAVTRMPTQNMIPALPLNATPEPVIGLPDSADLLVEALWVVAGHHQMVSRQFTSGSALSWTVHASPEFRADQPIAIPDLAGVDGWPDVGLVKGAETSWSISATEFDSQELARDHPTRERVLDRVGWSGELPQ